MLNILRRIKYLFASLPHTYYQFSAMSFLFWAAMTGTSFTTVYLQGLNFSAIQIGTMSAAFTTINIVAPPLWGIVSDKWRSVKKVFALCFFSSAVFWFILPFSVRWISPMIVLLILPFYRIVGAPTMSLHDGWIVRHVNHDRRIGFGRIRMWGSLGFAIIAFMYGIELESVSINIIFYLYAIFAVPCVILALSIKEDYGSSGRSLNLREMQLGRIVRTKQLMAYLVFNILIYAPLMASFTFMPFLIQEVGGHSSFLGTLLSFEALTEMVLLILSVRLLKRFKLTHVLIFVGFLYAAEVVLYGFCQAPWHIFILKCAHGLGYGLYLSCTVQYVYRLAPKNLTSTAQTLVSCSSALSGIIGSIIGGTVIQSMGARVFFRYSGLLMVLVAAAYAAWIRLTGASAALTASSAAPAALTASTAAPAAAIPADNNEERRNDYE